jgi:small subunit ribosomal protein S4e
MAHLKRQQVPKEWPVHRKGTTFVVKPNFKGLPILVILRDVLKIAKNRKEVKRALYEKKVLLNGKIVREEKNSAVLFDVLTIVPSKENYRVELKENGKFKVKKISDAEAKGKVAKIINKKTLKGEKVQINLSDGRNVLSDMKCNVGDSIVMSFEKNKVEKCLALKEKTRVIVFSGKHAGKQGEVKKIKSERNMASLNVNGEDINVLIKQIMVIE